jgi:hypothetical protein
MIMPGHGIKGFKYIINPENAQGFECSQCGQVFLCQKVNALRIHLEHEHQVILNTNDMYQTKAQLFCRICDYESQTFIEWRSHFQHDEFGRIYCNFGDIRSRYNIFSNIHKYKNTIFEYFFFRLKKIQTEIGSPLLARQLQKIKKFISN